MAVASLAALLGCAASSRTLGTDDAGNPGAVARVPYDAAVLIGSF